jgi:ubiquinone/menaquinone biosynthesis C-methylase UbiE
MFVNMDKDKSGKENFNRWAPSYDRSILQRLMFGPTHDRVLTAYESLGNTPRKVLDIGCGTGRLLERAAQRWSKAELVGIDLSEGMISEALRKHGGDGRYSFSKGDAASLPFESALFDVAFSTMSFHHWEDQASGIREVARVLQIGGVFVLADIYLPFLLRPLVSLFDRATFRDMRTMQEFFEQAGLSVVSSRRWWIINHSFIVVGRKEQNYR